MNAHSFADLANEYDSVLWKCLYYTIAICSPTVHGIYFM